MIRRLVTLSSIATGISCFPTSCMYKNPFRPPCKPKLSSIENNIKNNDAFLKAVFFDVNK